MQIIQSSVFDPLIPYIEFINAFESRPRPFYNEKREIVGFRPAPEPVVEICIRIPDDTVLNFEEIEKYFTDDFNVEYYINGKRNIKGTLKDYSLALYLAELHNKYVNAKALEASDINKWIVT